MTCLSPHSVALSASEATWDGVSTRDELTRNVGRTTLADSRRVAACTFLASAIEKSPTRPRAPQ